MRILVINPNTNPKNTKVIEEAISNYRTRYLQIHVVNPEKGPVGLESFYHNYLATVEVLKLVVEAEKQKYDGVVIAAFGDPGVEAAKELVNIPVVGMTEASYALARLLSTKFLVVVSADTAVPRQTLYMRKLGVPDYQYAIKPIGLTVLDVVTDQVRAKDLIAENCKRMLKETNAELVVLGCSGFSGLRSELEKQLGVPVIDPIIAGVHICAALVRMGLSQSKVSTYRNPPIFEIKV
jgi:allantoin racemase